MLNIALFGTSADPPTAGHKAVLLWLSQRFDQVAVWASDNPFKLHQTPIEHRMAMLQLLIKDLTPLRHNVQVYPQLSHPRTLHTLEVAQMLWRDAAFTLVIGSDLIEQLPGWYRVEELLKQVNLLVIPRPGYPLKESILAELRRRGATIAIASLTGLDVSSTAYREHGNSAALTPPVEAYIHQEQLYSCQAVSREKQPVH